MTDSERIIKRHVVGIGCVHSDAGVSEMVSYAIGSCIALCLYDHTSGVGAMAHILLPSISYTGHGSATRNIKYADNAVNEALSQMFMLGADRKNIRAAIIGGAKMFPFGNSRVLNIGDMNTASVTQELIKLKIPLLFTDVGGNRSRTVFFKIPGIGFSEQILVKSPVAL